ncbi:MAG: DUF1415 domain-containing protein [Deltaproteobacteria bacterium]|nr:DUF1415 domain-containing protein [Deltaproteobacteria bacterium]
MTDAPADPPTTDAPTADPHGRLVRWIEEAVIGLSLCPFAASPWRAGKVRLVVSAAATPDDATKDALEAAWSLLEVDADVVSTTLVAYPSALADFETFLDAAATVEHILDQAGARGVLQVATFHPAFQFEDSAPDDLGNWTNRAPYPVIHLLREAEVADAIDKFPDTLEIPERNVARLEAMGRAAVLALWGRL